MTDKASTALARQQPVIEGEIVDASSYNATVAKWQDEGFNVLTPVVSLNTIPRDHRIIVNRIQINPNKAAGEVHDNPLFCKPGEVALTKPGLEKIAQCAGISIDESVRVDSRTVEFLWSYRVRGHWIGFDGNRIDRQANKTLDLRDGSAELKGFKPDQIVQARRHGEAVCESKAINRLYRMYGLRQKYTAKEIAERPFIVLKLQWEPDMNNPVVAALVTQMRMGATTLLYPQGMPSGVDPAALPPHQVPPEMRAAGPMKEVEGGDDDPPASGAADIPMESSGATHAEPRSFLITDVRRKTGGGFYCTTEETGEERLHIEKEEVAGAADKAAKEKRRVDLAFEKRGQDRWVTELTEPY